MQQVKTVRKQPVKLNAQQAPLCQEGAVLLDDREVMGDPFRIGNHHGFAQQCTAFGTGRM